MTAQLDKETRKRMRKALVELLGLGESELLHLEKMLRNTVDVAPNGPHVKQLRVLHRLVVAAIMISQRRKRKTKPGIGAVKLDQVVGSEWEGDFS